MNTWKKLTALALGALMITSLTACSDSASSYPNKTITMIVPAEAGALIDTQARDIASRLDLGEQVIVSNMSGASQSIGTQELIQSDADGYIIGLISSSGLFTSPLSLGLDYTASELRPVAITQAPNTNMVVTYPGSGYETWADVLAAVEAGEEVIYSTGNAGSMAHMGFMELLDACGIEMKFVSYNGSSEAEAALIGGHIDIYMVIRETSMSKVDEGTFVPLVMFTDDPVEGYEDVALAGEYGVQANLFDNLILLAMPGDTPDDIYEIVKAEVDEMLVDEDYIAGRVASSNLPADVMTEEELVELIDMTVEVTSAIYASMTE